MESGGWAERLSEAHLAGYIDYREYDLRLDDWYTHEVLAVRKVDRDRTQGLGMVVLSRQICDAALASTGKAADLTGLLEGMRGRSDALLGMVDPKLQQEIKEKQAYENTPEYHMGRWERAFGSIKSDKNQAAVKWSVGILKAAGKL